MTSIYYYKALHKHALLKWANFGKSQLNVWQSSEILSKERKPSVPGRSRTGDLPLRRRLLYPLSYWDEGWLG